MKCVLLAGFLLTLLGHGYGHVLRCSDGNDAACTNDEEKVPAPPVEVSERQTECLDGSEWESNCHYCRCADGVAECLRQEVCDDGVFAEPMQCKPNTTFQRDCNTCVCLESGLALCTIQFCRRSATIPAPKSELPEGKECAIGSTWKSRCNTCTCMPSGYASCTEIGCLEDDRPEIRCAPDTAWRDQCNTCVCADHGAACTRAKCISLPESKIEEDSSEDDELIKGPVKAEVLQKDLDTESKQSNDPTHNLLKRSVCKPNQEFQSECNTCQCAPDGQRYTCTQNECLERDMNKEVEVFMESEGVDHIERHSVCRPSDTFYIGCNTCHCNPSGTDYSCTNKPCPLPDDVELFHELQLPKAKTTNGTCKAKAMFIKDCNVCWCNDDGTGYFCTRRVCVTDLPEEVGVEERPENTSLVREARAVQEAPKACQPGEKFRLDCNTCLCDNSGQDFSCTRMDCNAHNNQLNDGVRTKRGVSNLEEVAANCTPGSTFEQECNACKCTADGHHALCTNKKCTQEPQEKATTDVHSSDADPGFRCNPGEQFKKDCNDCTCSADGRSTFCTLRLCDQDITPGI